MKKTKVLLSFCSVNITCIFRDFWILGNHLNYSKTFNIYMFLI